MIPRGLVGKIVKNRPLLEPIRLQDLEDSARSQGWKIINLRHLFHLFITLSGSRKILWESEK